MNEATTVHGLTNRANRANDLNARYLSAVSEIAETTNAKRWMLKFRLATIVQNAKKRESLDVARWIVKLHAAKCRLALGVTS